MKRITSVPDKIFYNVVLNVKTIYIYIFKSINISQSKYLFLVKLSQLV